MSGARRRSVRPRRYAEEGEELEMDPGGNMWAHMLQQQQEMLRQQQAMHRQYREQ
ncbi:hypothetical protein A2U01_0099344 [Trifolium medium]|nr:hypothetical protein [Trifolium medium]